MAEDKNSAQNNNDAKNQDGQQNQGQQNQQAQNQGNDGGQQGAGDKGQQKQGKQDGDGKQGAEAKAPGKYDLKIPDGSLLGKEYLQSLEKYAKEKGLSNEQAQELLNRENDAAGHFQQQQKLQQDELINTWIEGAKTDKEIGGDDFPKNVETAKRVLDRFGTEAIKKELNETGLGNHPELIRLLCRIGKSMSDDQLVLAGAHGGEKKSLEEVFYGKPENKSE